MLNTSVLDINSTSVYFNFDVCFNGIYVGMFVCNVAASLCFILGTPAQCWLLWLYLRGGWKIKPTQVFPLNLAILELIYCIQCPLQIINVLINNSTLWTVILFIAGPCWVGRPLMQVCICVEQYLAVIHPIMFLKYNSVQYRIAPVVIIWLMVAACAVYEMHIDTFADRVFNSVFFISVIIILFCCVSVLRALKHPGPGDSQIPMERGRDVGNQQKRNAFNTIFTGLLIILITYLPQASLNFTHLMQLDKEFFRCHVGPLINSFNMLGMMITPLLKMYKNGCMKCF